MNTLTIKEGVLRYLDGEEIMVMSPVKMNEVTMEDLQVIFNQGGFCVHTEDLKKKPEPEPEPEAKPEPEQEPQKTKVDLGKIRALAAAGRSVQWIAKDMGLSAPTVRKYLNGD